MLKARNYKDLSVYFQKLESYIFIDRISHDLVDAGIVPYTIHDSIVVETKHEQQTIEIMERVFRAHFSSMPTLKVTYLGTGDTKTGQAGESGLKRPCERQAKYIRDGVDVTARMNEMLTARKEMESLKEFEGLNV